MANNSWEFYRVEDVCSERAKRIIDEGKPEAEKIARDLERHGNVMYKLTPEGKIQHIPREVYDVRYSGEDGGGS